MPFLQQAYYYHEEKKVEFRAPSFIFRQCAGVLRPTGRVARNLRELRREIGEASGASLFHHTREYFMKGGILQYTNDFAQWAGESLEERGLAEHFSSIDPYEDGDPDSIRKSLLAMIDAYTAEFPEPREVIPGNEFYFNENLSIAFPIGVRARNLAEFLIAIRFVDPVSIYYHFYEARGRLGGGRNDFSLWLEEGFGKNALAERIAAIDPFMHNLEGIREVIVKAVEEEVRRDMEGAS